MNHYRVYKLSLVFNYPEDIMWFREEIHFLTAIRVKTHLDSVTVHLPQLKPLVGKDVEIIVLDKSAHSTKSGQPKPFNWKKNFGRGWPGGKNDGFEKAIARWRKQDKPRNLPDE